MEAPPILLRAATPLFATDLVVDVPGFGVCRPIDIYDAWRFAQAEVDVAFRMWREAPPADRRELHLVYRASSDREQQAAAVLAAVCPAAPASEPMARLLAA
jgi:hypothetical protein